MQIIVLIILSIAFTIILIIYSKKAGTMKSSREYLKIRPIKPDKWLTFYNNDQIKAVNEALEAIISAFLLKSEDINRLEPNDKLIDIYRAAYPNLNLPDTLEFETLVIILTENCNVSKDDLKNITSMTVQEIIQIWINNKKVSE